MSAGGRKRRGRSGADELLALGLASGLSIVDAARAAGVSERTARRRLGGEGFAGRVDELRDRMVSQAVGRLADATTEAADALRSLLRSGQEYVRLSAAREVLAAVYRLHYDPKLREIDQELRRLRKRCPDLFADDEDDTEDA